MFDFIGRQMVCAGLLGLGGMVALSGLAGAEPQRGGGGRGPGGGGFGGAGRPGGVGGPGGFGSPGGVGGPGRGVGGVGGPGRGPGGVDDAGRGAGGVGGPGRGPGGVEDAGRGPGGVGGVGRGPGGVGGPGRGPGGVDDAGRGPGGVGGVGRGPGGVGGPGRGPGGVDGAGRPGGVGDDGRRVDGDGRIGDDGRRVDGDGRIGDDGRRVDGDGRIGGDDGRRVDGYGRIGGVDGIGRPGAFPGEMNLSRYANVGGVNRYGANAVRPYSINTLNTSGAAVRENFYRGGYYGGAGWYDNHFRPWWPGAYVGPGVGFLAGATFANAASWTGTGAVPVPYNYGTTVVYQDDQVVVQGEPVGTPQEYSQQASDLAAQGDKAQLAQDEQWKSLGVFALGRADEKNPSNFIQLGLNQAGVVRGTYYNAVTDSNMKISGQLDTKTQRVAWTVDGKKSPVYEAGLNNLTQDQTTILVHQNKDKVEQMLLVRVNEPESGSGGSQTGE